jgi:hypothetical protein
MSEEKLAWAEVFCFTMLTILTITVVGLVLLLFGMLVLATIKTGTFMLLAAVVAAFVWFVRALRKGWFNKIISKVDAW